MYGLIGKIKAVPGKRDELAAILLESGSMPGCLSYVVATDPENADVIWVSEVWTDARSHKASLELEAVKDAISRGMPLIDSFEQHTETQPLGGIGLPASDNPST